MNCPVCHRNNAAALSVCPGCGTMISDSARLDLSRVQPAASSAKVEAKINSTLDKTSQNADASENNRANSPTSSISTKLTSPTLIEFHSANATLPEWRLQLQNTVRQRSERGQNNSAPISAPASRQPNLVTKGATALKIESFEEPATLETEEIGNPKLASALERIKNSRQRFLAPEESAPEPTTPEPVKSGKNYPFYIASKTNESDVRATVNPPIRPILATSLRAETQELDTNKLPPLPTMEAQIATSFESKTEVVVVKEEANIESFEKTETKIIAVKSEQIPEKISEPEETEVEETDDSAPFAMRFNAGLFDLIIGAFLSLILLSPFILMSEGWSSTAGIFAFLATCAVVMFAYLTTTISMYGKTFGMRLFSLELIDIEGENYPTLHQAAVSSSVYLLSLAFGGAGFLTLLFNDEKRAVHDLVSGTIVVKEE